MECSCWKIVNPITSDGIKALYRCVCGIEKMVNMSNVNYLKSKSCGCQGKRVIPNSVKRTFSLMKYRCETTTSPDYINWGAKGIKVIYKDYYEFYDDVGEKPSKHHSIDRINHLGNYEKGNCRWATTKTQSNNKSNNRPIEYKGISKNLSEWAEDIGIGISTLKYRLDIGISVNDAFEKEVHKGKSKAGKISQANRKQNE